MKIPALMMLAASLFLHLCVLGVSPIRASQVDDSVNAEAEDEQQQRNKQFEEMLSGVKLVGQFTILGRDTPPKEEEYTISKVAKMPAGDYWLFTARIKYGDNDYTVPLPLQVKWSDDTPMITLTNLSIVGQGPFSARVIFYNEKYAGTWSHGEVGGHMFGKIVKIQSDTPAETGDGESR